MSNRLKILAAIVLGIFLCFGSASAYTTAVLTSGEPSLDWILTDTYGAGNYLRVEDDLDQLWMLAGSAAGDLVVKAKYAGHTHDFGYFLESSPTVFNTAISSATVGETGTIGDVTENFYFGIFDVTSQTYWSSHESDNGSSAYDHMVTHRILNSGYDFHYVVAFEDLNLGDRDYNDLVVEVRGIKPVPEPANMFLMGTGLLGLAVLGRRKVFKK